MRNEPESTPPVLERDDWDLERALFDLSEGADSARILRLAFAYEYARSSSVLVDAFRSAEQQLRLIDGTWECYLIKPKKGEVSPEACFPYFEPVFDPHHLSPADLPDYDFDLLIAPPGFPEKPFVQTNYLDHLVPQGARGLPSRQILSRMTGMGEHWTDQSGRLVPADEAVHLRVDWNQTDATLVREFADWLIEKENRPRKPTKKPGMSEKRQYGRDLKALGAWRLMSAHSRSISAARKCCQREGRNDLFVRDEDWHAAFSRAAEILEDFDHRIVFSDAGY